MTLRFKILKKMYKNRKRLGLMAVFLIGLTSCQMDRSLSSETVETTLVEVSANSHAGMDTEDDILPKGDLEIFFISDVHYLSESLYEMNETFNRFMTSGDDKLIQYSTEIIEAFIAQIQTERPDYLIVSGDLTTNGELASHQDLASYFKEIEALGTQVLVIPGNHDINNPYALSFLNNDRAFVDSISPEAFEDNYGDFGYKQAIAKDPNSLSYLAKLSDDTYALMLDTCVYDINDIMGYPVTRGILTDETLMWIDSLSQLIPEYAKVFSVSHHNMLVHAEILSEGYTLDNAQEAVEHLEALGIEVNFSGHIHTQDWKQKDDFVDIVTGAMIQYPQTYASYHSDHEGFVYETHWVDVETYAKEKGIQDAFLLDFQNAAGQYFYDSSLRLTHRVELDRSEAEIALMGDVVARLNMAYFAGEEPKIKSEIETSEGYKLWLEETSGFVARYIHTLTADDYYGNYFEYTWPND